MRLGLMLGYGNAFGVESGPECWGEGGTPPPVEAIPWAIPPFPPLLSSRTSLGVGVSPVPINPVSVDRVSVLSTWMVVIGPGRGRRSPL